MEDKEHVLFEDTCLMYGKIFYTGIFLKVEFH